jgi:hypothetical protein
MLSFAPRDKDPMAKFLTRFLTYLLAIGKNIMHTERRACTASMPYQSTRGGGYDDPVILDGDDVHAG